MKLGTLCRVVALALMFAPLVAEAADVNVQYLVDFKDLRKNAPAGTSLTFQLYTDSACTVAAGSSVNVNVENIDLLEKVITRKVKGGPKPPNVARLSETLTGMPTAPLLKVTGTGITPFGAACQRQADGAGLSCWDLNGNGVCDTEEDRDGDG